MSKLPKKDQPFSVTEVGTLVESFRNDISVVAERVGTLCEDVAMLKLGQETLTRDNQVIKDVLGTVCGDVRELKTRMASVETKLSGVEENLRTSFTSTNVRLSALEAKAG